MGTFVPLLWRKFLAATLVYAVSGQSRQLFSVDVENFEGTIRSDYIRQRSHGSVLHCQTMCLEDKECISFFHNPVTGMCQTHGVVFFYPDDGQVSPGTRYYKNFQDFCPSALGYIYNRALDFCYNLHYLNARSPTEARQVCQDEGGDMVILDTMEKIAHIGWTIGASTFSDPIKGFLIGATAEGYAANDWHWFDGMEVDLTVWNWCPGRPKKGRKDVALLTSYGYPPACMRDVLSGPRHFVCEHDTYSKLPYWTIE